MHSDYDRRHGEIFNTVQQERLASTLRAAVDAIQAGEGEPKRGLDFGCGTGNLTRHFLELGLFGVGGRCLAGAAPLAQFQCELEEAAQHGGWWNPRAKKWQRFLIPEKYIWGLRRLRNPRFQLEGDIHVWDDDHIEWSRIEDELASNACELLWREDYLLYREGYPSEVYDRHKGRCGDMSVGVARKHG